VPPKKQFYNSIYVAKHSKTNVQILSVTFSVDELDQFIRWFLRRHVMHSHTVLTPQ